MKGSTTVNQSDKLKEIIKERNRVIEYYKEKSQGLEQLSELLKCLLFGILKANKSSIISKKDISYGIGKNLISLYDDEENYYVSVCDPTGVDCQSESNEEDEI